MKILPKYNIKPDSHEEKSDNTRVAKPEIHKPVKRLLLKQLVTQSLMELATRNKPVLSQDAESRHGAPKAETFIGEMARVAGKDFVKADQASVAASMANPIANTILGSMDLGMNLNRSLHENTMDQNANTTLSALAILPFVRNGLKMAKAKDWVGKFRNWYENAITAANNPNEVNRALLMSRYWNAVDDSHTLDAVTNRFRNQEWSNFLTTKNGDSYYRIGIDGKPINNAEKYFISHTTPWEEFSGLGTELPMGADILYEFPTKTFGRLMSTTDKGIKTGYDVVDMGKNHLLYGNTASGQRGFVKTVPDNVAEQAKANGIDVLKIGILDRPLKPNGLYDTRPVYEDIYMGNQTTVGGRRLNNALLNTEYKIYRRTPNGIQTEIYSPGMYIGQTPDWRNPINNALDVKQLDAMLGEFVGKGAERKVFEDRRYPGRVIKIGGGLNGQENIVNFDQLLDAVTYSLEMNKLPGVVPLSYEGFVDDGGKLIPWFSQQRVFPMKKTADPFHVFSKQPVLPNGKTASGKLSAIRTIDVDKTLKPLGYNPIPSRGNAFYTVSGYPYLIGDLGQKNIGFDQYGNIKIFDPLIEL